MRRAVLVGLMLLLPCGLVRAGTLHGTVILPPETHSANDHWRVENGILPVAPRMVDPRTDVIVVLDGDSDGPPTRGPIRVDLHDLRVDPRVIVAPVDATVQFKNSDRVPHTLYIEHGSPALMPPLATPPGDTRSVQFATAGVYAIRDAEFAHIRATVLVLSSAFHSRVDDHGNYRVVAPNGQYTLKVFDGSRWALSRAIDLNDKTPELDLRLPAKAQP